MEEQFGKFLKEQNEINTLYAKRFNSLGSQFNQLHFLVQELNNQKRDTKDFIEASSPKKENIDDKSIKDNLVKQPEQREMMPTSVFQSGMPLTNNPNLENQIPPPMVTTNKKNEEINDNKSKMESNINPKKVVNIDTLSDDVRISEDSSDEDDN